MKRTTITPDPEFSKPLLVDKIPAGGFKQTLEASALERLALAERFGLLELTALRGELVVKSAPAGAAYAVTGILTADVVQQCGVTLDALPAHIEEPINVLFTVPASRSDEDTELDIPADDVDTEPLINGAIDLGELIAQHLGAALDPFPRKPGLTPVIVEYGSSELSANPFTKLIDWPKKPKDHA